MAATQSSSFGSRFDTLVGLAIALVTVTAALVLWQGSMLDSGASDVDREGLIDTVRREAAYAEDVRFLYQEATNGLLYDVSRARVHQALLLTQTYNRQGDAVGVQTASSLARWLDQAASGLANFSPLTSDESYRLDGGRFDLGKRLRALRDQNPDLRDLQPEITFQKADRLHTRSRRLTGTVMILSLALFAFTLAQITANRLRYLFALGGVGLYGLGVALVFVVMFLG